MTQTLSAADFHQYLTHIQDLSNQGAVKRATQSILGNQSLIHGLVPIDSKALLPQRSVKHLLTLLKSDTNMWKLVFLDNGGERHPLEAIAFLGWAFAQDSTEASGTNLQAMVDIGLIESIETRLISILRSHVALNATTSPVVPLQESLVFLLHSLLKFLSIFVERHSNRFQNLVNDTGLLSILTSIHQKSSELVSQKSSDINYFKLNIPILEFMTCISRCRVTRAYLRPYLAVFATFLIAITSDQGFKVLKYIMDSQKGRKFETMNVENDFFYDSCLHILKNVSAHHSESKILLIESDVMKSLLWLLRNTEMMEVTEDLLLQICYVYTNMSNIKGETNSTHGSSMVFALAEILFECGKQKSSLCSQILLEGIQCGLNTYSDTISDFSEKYLAHCLMILEDAPDIRIGIVGVLRILCISDINKTREKIASDNDSLEIIIQAIQKRKPHFMTSFHSMERLVQTPQEKSLSLAPASFSQTGPQQQANIPLMRQALGLLSNMALNDRVAQRILQRHEKNLLTAISTILTTAVFSEVHSDALACLRNFCVDDQFCRSAQKISFSILVGFAMMSKSQTVSLPRTKTNTQEAARTYPEALQALYNLALQNQVCFDEMYHTPDFLQELGFILSGVGASSQLPSSTKALQHCALKVIKLILDKNRIEMTEDLLEAGMKSHLLFAAEMQFFSNQNQVDDKVPGMESDGATDSTEDSIAYLAGTCLAILSEREKELRKDQDIWARLSQSWAKEDQELREVQKASAQKNKSPKKKESRSKSSKSDVKAKNVKKRPKSTKK